MAVILGLIEGTCLFAAVSAVIVLWVQPVVLDWIDAVWLGTQAAVVSSSCIIAFYYNELYDLRVVHNVAEFASRLLCAFGVAFLLLAGFYAAFPETAFGRGPFFSSVLIIVGLLLPLRAVTYSLMRRRPFVDRVIILGTGPLAQSLVEEIESRPDARCSIVGLVDEAEDDGRTRNDHGAGGRVLGPLTALDRIIAETQPDRIIVALTERRGRMPVGTLLELRVNGTMVEDGVSVLERLTGKLAVESVTPSHLIFSADFRKSRVKLAAGRVVSFVLALVGLVLTAPLFVLVAAAIKLDSRGPIFYAQDRVGLHGKRFRLVKFRTMHPADETSIWYGDNRDRITRIGRYLRKFRLDELPQFIALLRGDMNLVGPRPHRVPKFELFMRQIPYFSLRSCVRPGLTGWAQVRYRYASTFDEEFEKVRYDLYYIKHMSLWLDLRIISDTVKTMLVTRGSFVPVAHRGTPHPQHTEETVSPVH